MQSFCSIKTILFITANLDDLIRLQLALYRIPFDIDLKHSYSFETIIELLDKASPDLLLLDLETSGKDIYTGIPEIRKNSKYNQLAVIIYSSSQKGEHIDETYKNGANFCLIKSYSIRKLVEQLNELLSIDWKNYCYFPPRSEFVIGK
jgi:DNA-binding response OmpR family regulator